ncbi:NAD(P)-dependent glycerol-3-phosphate dehydrogenase [Rothia sp. AR01]|uniref:Glycerol-3-phosphate dehydrogenase [NAD(P)+] n=1 Tax=Rothia santali TaxID=2949643 RepID=A0A9X2KLK2_9MICC|nr:NAD(P)H-dependent glycerol-3-phosphate dehydrogenase [Rothia santali]MCP3426251.1 NAD(P)-dependent glycerol-3-phosphate dehydrogenase [Rothia santali]
MAVLGAGSWGTVFAKIAADAAARSEREGGAGWSVTLWGRDPKVIEHLRATGVNDRYFPTVRLPANLGYEADARRALEGADVVVLAIPAQALREQLTALADAVPADAVLVSLAKGLERGTGLRMSEVIAQAIPGAAGRTAVVSGPNLAREIIQEQPTASVVAAASAEVAGKVSRICATDYFRPYTSADVVGVEIGGLVKNVIALCVGMCEGRDLGDNSKASIMTRGLAETSRLALALGGRHETMAGLAGMGDLVATCSSPLSRNHTAGRLLGTGLSEAEVSARMTQTAEGIKSAPVVLELAREHGVEMPIVEGVVAVLSGAVSVDQLQPMLLRRKLKAETPHVS